MLGGYLNDVTTAACAVTESGARSRTLFRSLAIVSVVICPALVMRILGVQPEPVLGLLIYGGAVVGASFVLAWAAEAAQIDVSGSLAVAVLAVIAVLPEYAVDLYYAYTAGHAPAYTQYAAANMTGSNRLLMGLDGRLSSWSACWSRAGPPVAKSADWTSTPATGLRSASSWSPEWSPSSSR